MSSSQQQQTASVIAQNNTILDLEYFSDDKISEGVSEYGSKQEESEDELVIIPSGTGGRPCSPVSDFGSGFDHISVASEDVPEDENTVPTGLSGSLCTCKNTLSAIQFDVLPSSFPISTTLPIPIPSQYSFTTRPPDQEDTCLAEENYLSHISEPMDAQASDLGKLRVNTSDPDIYGFTSANGGHDYDDGDTKSIISNHSGLGEEVEEVDTLRNRIQVMEQIIRKLFSETDEDTRHISFLCDQIRGLEQRIGDLTSELEETRQGHMRFTKDLTSAWQEKFQDVHESHKRQLTDLRSVQQKETEALHTEKQTQLDVQKDHYEQRLRAKDEDLREQQRIFVHEINKQRKAKSEWENKCQLSRQRVSSLEPQVNKLDEKLQDAREMHQTETYFARQRFEDLTKRYDALKEEGYGMQLALAKANANRQKLCEEKSALENELVEFKTELGNIKSLLKDAKSDLENEKTKSSEQSWSYSDLKQVYVKIMAEREARLEI